MEVLYNVGTGFGRKDWMFVQQILVHGVVQGQVNKIRDWPGRTRDITEKKV